MKEKPEQLITASFNMRKLFCLWRKPHLGVDVVPLLRPFHALRQPVQVTGCRGAFFYLWKGVNEYEPEIHLPRLWDLLGL